MYSNARTIYYYQSLVAILTDISLEKLRFSIVKIASAAQFTKYLNVCP